MVRTLAELAGLADRHERLYDHSHRPMCWIDPQVIEEARTAVARQEHPWGPLRRTGGR
ncbi:hypothetical protein RKD19_007669 [Streptomyces canus]|uniref:hypothetical protein n=1 Tax=Streptomyces sp. RP5T TaxID=2490848 RepID=UPI0021AD8D17|nr:hypothetical protein [Streptomyces sp. RP5T]